MINSIEQLGRNAGKVWDAINQNGPMTESQLIETTSLRDYELHAAIGWLARENKISKEDDIYQLMSKSEVIRIITTDPNSGEDLELKMNIGGKNIIKCAGQRNFPDGEVFTSPDANSTEGEIFVDLPVSYMGVTIQGIYLRLNKGIIEEYSAIRGGDTLKKIIETDKGSHRLGEVALGMNNGIEKVLKHPLFVEKVGGTLHIAIGASSLSALQKIQIPKKEKRN